LDVAHFGLSGPGDDYRWPYDAASHKPDTWAHALLGAWPRIQALSPVSATVGSPTLTLTISGTNFAPSATLAWDGDPLPTEISSSTQFSIAVAAGRLATTGRVALTIIAPGLEEAPSAPAYFTVENPRPALTALAPETGQAGGAGFTLTLQGNGFVEGATVLWDGQPRPTSFVDETELEVSVATGDLAYGRTVGISVLNPDPGGGGSNTLPFVVERDTSGMLFLPVVLR
jgi:hypothetical protein